MYLRHFGLREQPFSITPDPRFVYLSPRHRDGLAHLLYGLGQGGSGGFVVISGEVGTGKTTLCRLALEQLPEGTEVALILNPLLNPLELLEAICEELKLDVASIRGQNKALVDRLNQYLLSAHGAGKRVVLLLDEAQNLSSDALEQVRLLTNLETAQQKLLQIILLGQPELNEVLARPQLRQLNQRVTARYHLSELDRAETSAYVRHRLHVAGCDREIFSASALSALHQLSNGTPRVINIIADHSLLAGFASSKTLLDAALVKRAAADVLPRPIRSELTINLVWIWASAAACALIVIWFARTWLAAQAVLSPAPSVATPAQSSTAADYLRELKLPIERAEQLILCPERWQAGWRCIRTRAPLRAVRALEHPVLFVALEQLKATWPVQSNRNGLDTEVELLALYRIPDDAPAQIGQGYAGPGVAELARALHQRDGLEAKQSIYGPRMAERVSTLQRDVGLPVDGIAGPLVWIVLQDE